jgi:hypothetical protein
MMSIKADKNVQEKPSMCPLDRTRRDKDAGGRGLKVVFDV